MPADISRTTFDARNGYRAMVLMQGRVLLDADLNEQGDLTAHHDEIRSRDTVGRVGAARAEDPADPGPFAVVDPEGRPPVAAEHPAGVPWGELSLTPGRYYVDGTAVESFPPVVMGSRRWPPERAGAGSGPAPRETTWPLTDQPFGPVPAPTHTPGARVMLYLEAADHLVTADEDPRLLESALGGPDTTARRQTWWQVRWRSLEEDHGGDPTSDACADLLSDLIAVQPRSMVARIETPPAAADPCTITASGGYQRLENQLYRVQVHEEADGDRRASYLWSRENASVVARVLGLTHLPTGGTSRVSVDREGRDPELSIGIGDLVELTGPDHGRGRRPGILGTVVTAAGLDLEVRWLGEAPSGPDPAAAFPVLRRWEGGPTPLTTQPAPLEDGIHVRFPAGGTARTGDYWQIPARAVQLAYGLTAETGSIEWPPPGSPGTAAPPMGPTSHYAPLAVLVAGTEGWLLDHDCRSLYTPLTARTAVDLIGGDGQEALPGAWLDEPVLVAVRDGDRPVAGVRLRAQASDGGVLAPADPGDAADPTTGEAAAGEPTLAMVTGPDGVVRIRWRPDAEGPVTQVLTVQRIDPHDAGRDVALRVTARLSTAAQVAFRRDGCEAFRGVTTVEEALTGLAGHPELRLQGGDGQQLEPGQPVVPHPVRLIVDSPCGPVRGAEVLVVASEDAHVQVASDGEPRPESLQEAPSELKAVSGADGSVLLWWQPQPPRTGVLSDALSVSLAADGGRAPVVVTVHRSPDVQPGPAQPAAGLAGAHVRGVTLLHGDGDREGEGPERELVNDESYTGQDLLPGVAVHLDDAVTEGFGGQHTGAPALRVEVDLPWAAPPRFSIFQPGGLEPFLWGPEIHGARTVVLEGRVRAAEDRLVWSPGPSAQALLRDGGPLWRFADPAQAKAWTERGFLGRVVLEGWAVRTASGLAVNTHTELVAEEGTSGQRLVHRYPSDDAVAGGTFTLWFYLRPAGPA